MSELTDFLLARIAEDDAASWQWHILSCTSLEWGSYADCDCVGPARVLAECEAKRRIVAEYERVRSLCGADDPAGYAAACLTSLAAVIAALALPYADHPDYRDEWRL